jgi:Predicted dehydrogenases and related proteins
MKKITAALIGAGPRGMDCYAPYALEHPDEIKFIAVAEPKTELREKFKNLHGISDDMCFTDWQDMLKAPRFADALLICTQDKMHFQPAMKSLELGYNVLLEKPMSPNPQECVAITEQAKKYGRILIICHVLRYTSFFTTMKKLLDEGRIGRLISIQHNENVGYWHQAHSFVRGNWRNSDESSPMILAKSCHDMDILVWLTGSNCVSLSSYGALTHFRRENAPPGATKRCLDGCPARDECAFYAPKIYLTENTKWPASIISSDTSIEARRKALKEGPYGRCVYYCDNNVVDHQVVNMEFENEVTVAFTMCAFTNEVNRTIKLMGTKGEIRGNMHKYEIEVIDFNSGRKDIISLKEAQSGHGGGDHGLMRDFVKIVSEQNLCGGLTSADVSLQSHLMAFASEKSRIEKRQIDMLEYIKELKNNE